jgi:hypothetical protein
VARSVPRAVPAVPSLYFSARSLENPLESGPGGYPAGESLQMKNVPLLLLGFALTVHTASEASAATLTGEIAFTNLLWTDGSQSSGFFEYSFDSATLSLLQITSADITTVGGASIPSYTLIYSVPNLSDTSVVGFDYNRPAYGYEAAFFDLATSQYQIYLDWTGMGSSAQMVAITPGNVASISDNAGLTYYPSSQIGTSTGSLVATPEPGMLALAGLGLAGLMAARRKK